MDSSLIISNLNPTTVDLIDEIVDVVPRGSHSFLALFNAYNHVLDAHGIDQNDEVELYDLLLKLGVVKGRDWHERWQAIVNSDYNTGAFTHVFDNDDAHSSSSSSASTSNTNSDTRSTSTAALAAEARETDKEFPPIQYRHRQATTPATSSAASTTLQARAMASVQAQTNRVRQTELARRRQEQDRLRRTDEARRRELEEARQRADENKVLREMENIADTLYNQNVVTRTFKVWLGMFRWLQNNTLQIEAVQRSQNLTIFFQRWQYTMSKKVIMSTHVAVSHDKARVMSNTLQLWKSHLRHRIRHRKEARLRSTYASIRKGIARRLLQEAWQVWRDVSVTRRADVRYSFNIMSKMFNTWKDRTVDVFEKDNKVVEFATAANERRAAAYFEHWQHRTVLQAREKEMVETVNAFIIRRYFDTWKNRNDTNKAAAAWRHASSVRNAFYTWQRKLYKIQKYNVVADTFAQDREDDMKLQTLHQWRLSLKCYSFQLRYMHTLGHQALQHWMHRMHYTHERVEAADDFYYMRIRALGVSLFEKWKQRTAELREQKLMAIEFDRVNTQYTSLKQWSTNFKSKRVLNRRGYRVRRILQKKNAFQAWKAALDRRRQEEWIRRRELLVKNKSWTVWREKFSTLCDLRARENAFKAQHTHRKVATNALHQWLQKTVDRRDLVFSAEVIGQQKIARTALQRWREKSDAVKDLHRAAETYSNDRDEDTRNTIFQLWLRQARATTLRNKKCAEFTKEREERIVETAFYDWYDQIKTIELEPVETEMLMLRRERMLREAFSRWISTCTVLPAVQFHNESLKMSALRTWKAQLPSTRKMNIAMKIRRHDTLYKWFIMWKDNLQVKRSRRAIARARALASRDLPMIKPGRIASIPELERAINALRAIYTSTVAGIKVSNPTQGVDGWSTIHANDKGTQVYADDKPVTYETESQDDSFERRWSSNWLTRFIALGEEWLEEVDDVEERRERERVVEMAAAALACVAGMSAAGPIDRTFTFIGREQFDVVMHDKTVNGHEDVGAQTWGAAVHLSRLVCRYPEHFGIREDSRLLEVGAGTGLVGIACAHMAQQLGLNHTEVVLSDYLQDIIENLQRNVSNNQSSTPTSVIHLDWNDPDQSLGKFDTIFGADVCYDLNHAYLLHKAATQLLSKQGTFHILIALRKTHVGMKESLLDAFSGRFVQSDGDALCIEKTDYFDVEKGLGRADELGYARFEIGWKTKILSQQNGLEKAIIDKMASAARNMATKTLRFGMLPADGIGHEVLPPAQRVLEELSSRQALPKLEFIPLNAGFEYFRRAGVALPEETIEVMKSGVDGAMFGSVSSPSHKVTGYSSPIVALRKHLDLYANIRPVSTVDGRVDMVTVRENTECLYIKKEELDTLPDGTKVARATRQITQNASERIGKLAFEIALKRDQVRQNGGSSPHSEPSVWSIHKSNVLSVTDGLFRESIKAAHKSDDRFNKVKLVEQLVDSFVYRMFREPQIFDVCVAPNLYGDIISDGAAALVGSLGVVPSINANDTFAMGEPVHGSAPDIAGKNIANPIASIRSAALMIEHMGYSDAAAAIYKAVDDVLKQGQTLTPDLGGKSTTTEVQDAVLKALS
ncbi:hypothetical protein E3P99_02219 [Wallemia hederae]|uniref:Isopropylmalate dehydrogenase-like domain-containing protein n=1 Tax=Wallemia hederae TaxID=1540922 RepID=A0A4T0FLD3_9BASI|nr:hypothetical protein E3P99_02219 [Wallemia hederae]